MLANEEGFLTEMKGKINDISMLFDARSAPPESWTGSRAGGLLLDPLWAQINKTARPADIRMVRKIADRRRLLIRFARKLLRTPRHAGRNPLFASPSA